MAGPFAVTQTRAPPIAEPMRPADEPTPFWTAAEKGFEDGKINGTAWRREEITMVERWDRHREIERRLGRKLPLPQSLVGQETEDRDFVKRFMDNVIPTDKINAAILGRPGVVPDGEYDRLVETWLAEQPDVLADIETSAQMHKRLDSYFTGIRRESNEAADDGAGSFLGNLTGQLGAAVVDPPSLGFNVLTGGWGTTKSLATRVITQAGVSAGFEVLETPERANQSTYGGPQYTPGEAAADIALGGAGGGGLEVVQFGAEKAIKSGLNLFGPKAGTQADEDLAAIGFNRDQVVEPSPPELPPEVSPLMGGREPAPAPTPDISAPDAVRGAKAKSERLDLDALAVGQLRPGDEFELGTQALADGKPIPAIEPAKDVIDLFRERAALPADRNAVAGFEALAQTQYRGRPILAGVFDPESVGADAARFQFKAGGDAAGVTSRLRGVEEWDPTASGKAIVFEDADGRLLIADGHQRLGMAKRLAGNGQPTRLDGYLFRASDGWDDVEVRTIAALKNLREGSGSIIDGAKVFRAAPETMADRSIPVTGEFIAQSRALAGLSDDAFLAVVNKVVSAKFAAEIGLHASARQDLHDALIRLLADAKPKTREEARALVQESLLDDFVRREGAQTSLFGDVPMESTVIVRAKLKTAVMQSLRQDARVFAQLVKHADAIEAGGNALARDANEAEAALNSAAMQVLNRLAMRSGPVGEAMAAATDKVLRGSKPAVAARDVIDSVKASLKDADDEALSRKELLDPAPASPEAQALLHGFDEVDGPGAKAQAVPAPENAALEADPATHAPGLFDDIALADDYERAIQRLAPCVPGA